MDILNILHTFLSPRIKKLYYGFRDCKANWK